MCSSRGLTPGAGAPIAARSAGASRPLPFPRPPSSPRRTMGQIQGCPPFIRSRAGLPGKAPSARPLLRRGSRRGWAGVPGGRARGRRHLETRALPRSAVSPRGAARQGCGAGCAWTGGGGERRRDRGWGHPEGARVPRRARGRAPGARGAGSCSGPRGGGGRMPEPGAKQAGGRGCGGRGGPLVRISGAAHHSHPSRVLFPRDPGALPGTRRWGGAAGRQGLRLRSRCPRNRCGRRRAGRGMRGRDRSAAALPQAPWLR